MAKLAHVVAFFLLASLTQHLTARDLEIKVNDGLDALQLDVSQSFCPGVTKESWPDLLGVPAKLAKEVIQKDNPRLTNIPTVLNGSPVTADFRCDRVRLIVNVINFVVQIPKVG